MKRVSVVFLLAAVACGEPGRDARDTRDASTPDASDDSGTEFVPVGCVPAPRQALNEIPSDPSLDDGDEDTRATFEVEGHRLVGKFVKDRAAAEIGLDLWREIATRIPTNQLRDLVQFDVFASTDPVASFSRPGNTTTRREGFRLGFSMINAELNDADPCAPLVPRRGTFDWSLVHEFGHLRGWADGSWPSFLETFPDVMGDGDGYPDDGSPILTGDFVTSYAERADGDEDHAETFTTFVMLHEDALPPLAANESLALQKVRWMYARPGLRELRQALRRSEPDGGNADVPPAPRLPQPP